MSLRIALISEHASPLAAAGGVDSGGQNIYVAQVARHLSALGHSVDIFTRRDHPSLPDVLDWAPGVRVVHVQAGPAAYVEKERLLQFMPAFCEATCAFARANGSYNVSHANFFMSGLAALALKREFGLPFVVTFHALGRVRQQHQGSADRFPPQRTAIEEELVAKADSLVAECPQDREDLMKLYRADPAGIRVIPCGFDEAEFWPIARQFARKTLGYRSEERILLSVGRLVPRKGVDNVISALACLERDFGIEARLVVVGGDSDLPSPEATPEIGRLLALARVEGVESRVQFTGRRAREFLKLYYSAADIFVSTPWYEPFGITPLEAMACARPVVGADVGGIRFSVVEGVTGALVQPRNPHALGSRLAEMLRNEKRLRELGLNGLRRVHSTFTWKKVARSLAALYGDVAQAHRGAPELAA